MRRRSLIDLVQRAVDADPLDAPVLCLEADVMADDMERYAPATEERRYPVRAGREP